MKPGNDILTLGTMRPSINPWYYGTQYYIITFGSMRLCTILTLGSELVLRTGLNTIILTIGTMRLSTI